MVCIYVKHPKLVFTTVVNEFFNKHCKNEHDWKKKSVKNKLTHTEG